MENKKNVKYINSILKAAEFMEEIAKSESGLRVTDLSKSLGCSVSGAYNILNTLCNCNLLIQDKRTKKYRIGFALFSMSETAKGQNMLERLAKPYLEQLRNEVQETSNLTVLSGINSFCVAQIEGPHMIRMFTHIGHGNPFYHSAGGKVMVSFLPQEQQEDMISRLKFVKYTENTIVTANELRQELEVTRRRGYGIDNEEREIGMVCIGAPVFDEVGDAVAAISVSGPANRLKHKIKSTAEIIMQLSNELSRELGYLQKQPKIH